MRHKKYPLAGPWKMRTMAVFLDETSYRDGTRTLRVKLSCGHEKVSNTMYYFHGRRTRCYPCGRASAELRGDTV